MPRRPRGRPHEIRQPRAGRSPRRRIRTRHAARACAPALRALAGVTAGGRNREGLGRKARGPRTAPGSASRRRPPCGAASKTASSCAVSAAGRPCAGWPLPPRCCSFATIGFFAIRQPQLPATQIASIQADAQTIYWRVELLGDNQELAVQVQNAHELEAGKALELWILPAARQPGVAGPAAHPRRSTAVRSRPRSAPRSRVPGSSRSAWSPPGARPRAFPPVRCCTWQRFHRPDSGPDRGVKPFSIRDLRAFAL